MLAPAAALSLLVGDVAGAFAISWFGPLIVNFLFRLGTCVTRGIDEALRLWTVVLLIGSAADASCGSAMVDAGGWCLISEMGGLCNRMFQKKGCGKSGYKRIQNALRATLDNVSVRWCSWLSHLLHTQEVSGSSPLRITF